MVPLLSATPEHVNLVAADSSLESELRSPPMFRTAILEKQVSVFEPRQLTSLHRSILT